MASAADRWTTYYLSGDGGQRRAAKVQLISTAPGAQPPDTYTYDPAYPAPSLGGHSCCGAQSGPQGPYDQTPVEQRSDVLVYSSDAARHDTEMTGPTIGDAVGVIVRDRHRLHRQARRRQARRRVINLNNGILRDLIPGLAVRADADHAGSPVRYSDPDLADELRIPHGRPHPRGNLQQRLSSVRTEPQHRCTVRDGCGDADRRPDHPA